MFEKLVMPRESYLSFENANVSEKGLIKILVHLGCQACTSNKPTKMHSNLKPSIVTVGYL